MKRAKPKITNRRKGFRGYARSCCTLSDNRTASRETLIREMAEDRRMSDNEDHDKDQYSMQT